MSIDVRRGNPELSSLRLMPILCPFDSELSIAFLQVLSVRARAKNIFLKDKLFIHFKCILSQVTRPVVGLQAGGHTVRLLSSVPERFVLAPVWRRRNRQVVAASTYMLNFFIDAVA